MNRSDLSQLCALYKLVRGHWRRFVHLFVWVAVVALMRLPMPLFTKYIVDEGLLKKNMHLINLLAAAFLGFLAVNYIANVVKNLLAVRLRERLAYDLEIKLYEHIQSQPHAFFHNKSTGYLMARIANDVAKLQGLFSENLLGVVLDLVTLAAGLTVMFFFHWKLTLMCLGLLPFYMASLLAFGERIKRTSRELQESGAQVSATMQEGLSGFSVIKAFQHEKHEALRLSQRLRAAIRSRIKLTIQMTLSTSTTMTIGSLAPLLVLWYGGSEVLAGRLTVGEMIAFSGFLSYVFGPTQKLVSMNFMIKESLASFERIAEILGRKPEIESAADSLNVSRIDGHVAYCDVSFAYTPDTPVLTDVSFEADPGEIVALVGPSGAGKTTALNLLPRFYDPTGGAITIDGIDLRRFTLSSLRRHVGVVSQEGFLFSRSIAENIRYGRLNASREDVCRAAEEANVDDFVRLMPQGYDTLIGERGARLSGGQRQRIAIARVILKGSRILVFDEATSQLDSESERAIQQAMIRLKRDRIVLVIAHRLSTVLAADRIVVLQAGKVVGAGRHDRLYHHNPTYRAIFNQQFRERAGMEDDLPTEESAEAVSSTGSDGPHARKT